MALNGIPISENQCIGDSLPIINAVFQTLDDCCIDNTSRLNSLSATVSNFSTDSTSRLDSLSATVSNFGVVSTMLTGNEILQSFPINGYTSTAPEKYLVFMQGVHQHPGTDYTISLNTINFPAPPPLGTSISVLSIQIG